MKTLLENAYRAMPGGAFTTYVLDEEVDLVIRSGKGSKVVASDGRIYIDCVNGSGPMLLGHAHPAVVEALREAVECPSNYYFLNEKGIELAEMLVDAIPCAEQVKFGVTGSDANLYALRIARAYTGRDKVLKFEGGFLGGTDVALMSMGPMAPFPNFPQARPDSAGIPQSVEQDVLIAPYNDLEAVEQILAESGPKIAAIIIEAQQRCIPPLPGFLEGLRSLCDRYGILLIFDEVVTGFRLHWGGAQALYGVTPDLATYGKAIGGGLPLSAVAGPREIMQLCNPRRDNGDRKCFTGNTMCGNPIAATAGIATLKVLQGEGVYDRLNLIGHQLRSGMEAILSQHGVAGSAVGSGPLAAVCLTERRVLNHRDTVSGDLVNARRIFTDMVKRGILTHGRFYLSLAMTDEDIASILDAFDRSVQATFA